MDVQSAPAFGGGIPAGVVVPYAGSVAPAGWLLCFGQLVSRTTYAALFAAISTAYGVGDGSTTFGIPDLRGRGVFGKDDMGGTAASRLTNAATGGISGSALGNVGGEQAHADTLTETINHSHNMLLSATAAPNTGSVNRPTVGGVSTAGLIDVAGGSGAHNTVPPGIILNYMIATGGP